MTERNTTLLKQKAVLAKNYFCESPINYRCFSEITLPSNRLLLLELNLKTVRHVFQTKAQPHPLENSSSFQTRAVKLNKKSSC